MTIWKYKVPIQDEFSIELYEGYKILSVQTQGADQQFGGQTEGVYIWVLLDPNANPVTVEFSLYGTGHRIEMLNEQEFIGTFQMLDGRLVYHLFKCL
ncbi:MAG TPA: hypothetical protein VKR58_06120 [Aquella sp.]|nr:hypothetical protein [Aquella sp.]